MLREAPLVPRLLSYGLVERRDIEDRSDRLQQTEFIPNVDTHSHLRLSGIESLDEVLSGLEELRQTQPEFRFLRTLDDLRQCCYTSGNACEDKRLVLDAHDIDFDGPEFIHEHEATRIRHVIQQLQASGLQQAWGEVVERLAADEVGV